MLNMIFYFLIGIQVYVANNVHVAEKRPNSSFPFANPPLKRKTNE